MASAHSEGDFSSLPPEPQQGNVEYKLKLVNPTSQRLQHLVTQMKWRLREGQGRSGRRKLIAIDTHSFAELKKLLFYHALLAKGPILYNILYYCREKCQGHRLCINYL